MRESPGLSGLFVLWGTHVALKRRWYAALFKGVYRPFRIIQTIINCGILVCALFLMIIVLFAAFAKSLKLLDVTYK